MSDQLIKIVTAGCMLGVLLLGATSADAASSRKQVEAEQVRLDEVCETSRQKILSVERAELIEECVADKFPRADRAGCERFYADHGNATGGRAPLYMDIPECIEAHEFRRNRSR